MSRIVRPTGPKNAKIMIIGDAPSLHDSNYGVPFSGDVGNILNALLSKAGINREECYITNVVKTRITSIKYGKEIDEPESVFAESKKEVTSEHVTLNRKIVRKCVADAVEGIHKEILEVRPNVVIALGNVALWAIVGEWGITDWRGSIEHCIFNPSIKVIPSIHPRDILFQMEWRDIVLVDIRRAFEHSKTVSNNFSIKNMVIGPTFQDVKTWIEDNIKSIELNEINHYAFDIENPGGYIDTIGFSYDSNDAFVIPFWNKDAMIPYFNKDQESEILFLLYKMMTHKNFMGICQNANHEKQFIWSQWFFLPNVASDTMVNHNVMFPSDGNTANKKNLAFLSSLYCKEYKYWKDSLDNYESQDEYWEYNANDCMNTKEIYDEQTKRINLIDGMQDFVEIKNNISKILFNLTVNGFNIKQKNKNYAKRKAEEEIEEINSWIRDIFGFDININSTKQLQDLFYTYLGQPEIKRRVGKLWKPSVTKDAINKIGMKEPLLSPITRAIVKVMDLSKDIKTIDSINLTKSGTLHFLFDLTGSDNDKIVVRKTSFGYGGDMNNISTILKRMFIPESGCSFVELSVKSKFIVNGEFQNEIVEGTFYSYPNTFISLSSGLSSSQVVKKQEELIKNNSNITSFHEYVKKSVIGKGILLNSFKRRMYVFGERNSNKVKECLHWYVESDVNYLICKLISSVDYYYSNLIFINGNEVLYQVPDEFLDKFLWYLNTIIDNVKTIKYNDFGISYEIILKNSKNNWADIDE